MIPENIKRMLDAIHNEAEKSAFAMGYDCGCNGANKTNAPFSLFSRPELTKAWENGWKAAGEK